MTRFSILLTCIVVFAGSLFGNLDLLQARAIVSKFSGPGCRRAPVIAEKDQDGDQFKVTCFLTIDKQEMPEERHSITSSPSKGLDFSKWLAEAPQKKDTGFIENLIAKFLDLFNKKNYILSINNKIPGEELRFVEGDIAELHVTNALIDAKTSLHWHGILLPWSMDGVPGVTTPQIEPGDTRTFTFTLNQSGTYWYHSHSDLQEQQGVYGAFIIEPRKADRTEYDNLTHDLVIVLSDWSNAHPDINLDYLKSGSVYHLYKKDFMPSFWEAHNENALSEYLVLLQNRMDSVDYGDVAYDDALINGSSLYNMNFQNRNIKPGEKVRLRVINAAASSYFHVDIGTQPFKIIAADGINVQPLEVMSYPGMKDMPHGPMDGMSGGHNAMATDFMGMKMEPGNHDDMSGHGGMSGKPKHHMDNGLLLGMGETYDIVFEVPEKSHFTAFEFRATLRDMTTFSSFYIGDNSLKNHKQKINKAKRRPKLSNYKMPEGHSMGDMGRMMGERTRHPDVTGGMNSVENRMGGMMMKPTELHFPYSKLRSLTPTKVYSTVDQKKRPGVKKIDKIFIDLTGNMQTYVWKINGTTFAEHSLITIERGQVIQLVITNKTMMRHPMHLHGHFFRVLDPHDDDKEDMYSPLKHTVDVPMRKTITIEFLADAVGDWIFHCHNLYHIKAGMSKIIHYKGFEYAPSKNEAKDSLTYANGQLLKAERDELVEKQTELRGEVKISAFSNGADVEFVLRGKTDYEVVFEGEWDEYKADEIKAELYIHYYWFTNVTLFGGIRYEDRALAAVIGSRYSAGYDMFISFSGSSTVKGVTRAYFKVVQGIQLTDNLSLHWEAEVSPLISSGTLGSGPWRHKEIKKLDAWVETIFEYRLTERISAVGKISYGRYDKLAVGAGVRVSFPIR